MSDHTIVVDAVDGAVIVRCTFCQPGQLMLSTASLPLEEIAEIAHEHIESAER